MKYSIKTPEKEGFVPHTKQRDKRILIGRGGMEKLRIAFLEYDHRFICETPNFRDTLICIIIRNIQKKHSEKVKTPPS